MEQLRLIAAIPASDADGDRVRGLFLASHEVEGMAEWQIRGDALHVTVIDARFKYLDEQQRPRPHCSTDSQLLA